MVISYNTDDDGKLEDLGGNDIRSVSLKVGDGTAMLRLDQLRIVFSCDDNNEVQAVIDMPDAGVVSAVPKSPEVDPE